MKTYMTIAGILIILPQTLLAVGEGWLKGKYPKDLDQTTLLVEKIETGKPKWLPDYHRKQAKVMGKYNFKYVLLTRHEIKKQSDHKYADKNKYRYILKATTAARYIDSNPTDNSLGNDYMADVYYFHDRKTGKDYEIIKIFSSIKLKTFSMIINKLNKQFQD